MIKIKNHLYVNVPLIFIIIKIEQNKFLKNMFKNNFFNTNIL